MDGDASSDSEEEEVRGTFLKIYDSILRFAHFRKWKNFIPLAQWNS